MKQTAVDWLIEQLTMVYPKIEEMKLLTDKAKAMEKQQIVSAFEHVDFNLDDGLHYYTETYESNTRI